MMDAADDSFPEYQTKAKRLVTDEVILNNVSRLKPAERFNGTEPRIYPGYTIITPPFEDELNAENNSAYEKLARVQKELLKQSGNSIFTPVPSSSFHLTIADLISGSRFVEQQRVNGWEDRLRDRIGEIFHRAESPTGASLLVSGLSLFTSVIVAIISSEDRSGYEQLINVRNMIYQDGELKALGVRKAPFSFIGHITLAYVEAKPDIQSATSLSRLLSQFNLHAFSNPLPLKVIQAELRKFNDMSRYYRQETWPVLHFQSST